MYEFFKQLLANEQSQSKKFNIVDPGAVGDKIRSVTLSYIPSTEDADNSYLSLYWTDSQSKIFEKASEDEEELRKLFNAMLSDLNIASDLTKEEKVEEASSVAKDLFKKYDIYSDKLVDVDPIPGSTTQAKKAGRVVQRDVFFESEEDYAQFLEKTKKKPAPQIGDFKDDLKPAEDKPEPGKEEPGEIAPPNLSRKDYEKQQVEEQKSLTKRIEQEVQDQVESALEEKAASVFEPADEDLIEAMRGKGRTWEEIKQYYTKELKYDDEDVDAYINQKREEERLGPQPQPESEPKPESPKPPEDLVSPDTHDKLVDEVKDEKEEEPKSEEIEKQDIALAEIENQGLEINKHAQEPLETTPTNKPGITDDMHPKVDYSDVSNEDMAEDAANLPNEYDDDFDLETELNPGDHVYVMSDYDKPDSGYKATFISSFKKQGENFAVVDLGHNDLEEVPLRNIKRASFEKVAKKQKEKKLKREKLYSELNSINKEINKLKASLKKEAAEYKCETCGKVVSGKYQAWEHSKESGHPTFASETGASLDFSDEEKVANKKKADADLAQAIQDAIFLIHESQTKAKAIDIHELKNKLEDIKNKIDDSGREYIERALNLIEKTKEEAEIFDANSVVAFLEQAKELVSERRDYVNK